MIIDLSKNNIVTNWGNVKSAVDGIILRVGYRGYGSGKITKDARFAEYVITPVCSSIAPGAPNPTE